MRWLSLVTTLALIAASPVPVPIELELGQSVKTLLGHAGPDATRIYYVTLPDDLEPETLLRVRAQVQSGNLRTALAIQLDRPPSCVVFNNCSNLCTNNRIFNGLQSMTESSSTPCSFPLGSPYNLDYDVDKSDTRLYPLKAGGLYYFGFALSQCISACPPDLVVSFTLERLRPIANGNISATMQFNGWATEYFTFRPPPSRERLKSLIVDFRPFPCSGGTGTCGTSQVVASLTASNASLEPDQWWRDVFNIPGDVPNTPFFPVTVAFSGALAAAPSFIIAFGAWGGCDFTLEMTVDYDCAIDCVGNWTRCERETGACLCVEHAHGPPPDCILNECEGEEQRECSVAGGVGTQQCSEYMWGVCVATRCFDGFQLKHEECVKRNHLSQILIGIGAGLVFLVLLGIIWHRCRKPAATTETSPLLEGTS